LLGAALIFIQNNLSCHNGQAISRKNVFDEWLYCGQTLKLIWAQGKKLPEKKDPAQWLGPSLGKTLRNDFTTF
jgi:hypothetical protein